MGQWQIKWNKMGEANVLIDADESWGASLAYYRGLLFGICLVL